MYPFWLSFDVKISLSDGGLRYFIEATAHMTTMGPAERALLLLSTTNHVL